MTLTNSQLLDLSQLAIKAATKAGKHVALRRNENFSINKKEGGSSLASQVFTEVDLASQNIILDILEPSLDKYDLALLSEETSDNKSRFEKDFFWCIDPLDGTLPFIEQTDGYSISIALVSKGGDAIIGVIYNPEDSTLYHAIIGEGAFKNRQKWHLPEAANTITLVCDRSLIKHDKYNKLVNTLSRLSKSKIKCINHGGATMNAMWVLENHPAVYIKFPKKEAGGGSLWDYAASACIFNEMGALATDYNLQKLELNRIDSSFMNHKGICYASDKNLAQRLNHLFI